MSLTKYRMASRRQAERRSALLRRRAVLRWRRALSTYFVLCFDDVRCRALFVLCFGGAICFFLAICLLCATCFAPMHAKDAAVGESNCLRCLSLAAFPLSLSLPWRRRSLLFLSFPFSQEEHRTGTPATACILLDVCLLRVFAGAASPATENSCAFAPLCAPRAINSTPGGGRPHLY